MKLIAHRGFTISAEENSEAAFKASLPYKPYGIEMDVVIFEKELYIYHPKKSKQSFGQSVDQVIFEELNSMPVEDRKKLRLGNYVLDLLKGTNLLELDLKQKDPAIIPYVITAIEKLKAGKEQIVVGARDEERLNELLPYRHLFTILSLSKDPDSYPLFISKNVEIIRLWDDKVTKERVDNIHKLGATVWVTPGHPPLGEIKGTAGEVTPQRLLDLQALGIDAVLVNDIAMARKIIS